MHILRKVSEKLLEQQKERDKIWSNIKEKHVFKRVYKLFLFINDLEHISNMAQVWPWKWQTRFLINAN